MAHYLATKYGTEEDKDNCSFFVKTGTCRHGDHCSRVHNKPLFSTCICLNHLYDNPMGEINRTNRRLTPEQMHDINEQFLDFFEDVFDEAAKYGAIEDMIVCDNTSDHLVGNTWIRYATEEEASAALAALNGRWYNGRVVSVEFSCMTDFKHGRCRQEGENKCRYGGLCSYLHVKPVPRDMMQELLRTQPHPPPPKAYDDRDTRGGYARDDDRGRADRGGYRDYGSRDSYRDYGRDRDRDRGYRDRYDDRDRGYRGGSGGYGYDRDRDYGRGR